MRKGRECAKCPVDEFECDAQYRGSRCAALRAEHGADFDPEPKPCAWCKSEHEYTIIDDDFGQPLRPSMIHYCFNCGRKLRE